ncbi:MAG TPA: protease pro-enzyme activation domain-containing protein, partial [Candidatus Elarobacter sp.]|nr:protease pro-enzyme activation domain-containing protein [Candidatus Elarobacter sp.]
MTKKRFRRSFGCAVVALALSAASQNAGAASSRVTVPQGALAGLHDAGPADPRTVLHLAIELQPKADLDGLAAQMSDPANPAHRQPLSLQAFLDRFGRTQDDRAAGALLRSHGGTDVEVAGDGLVSGALVRVADAEKLFNAHWDKWTDGTRTVIAPTGPLSVPLAGVRDVRGAIVATAPKLADTRPSFTYFRGDWYDPVRFRAMTDAVDNGGGGQRIVLVEDASDQFEVNDIRKFLLSEGAPPGADMQRISERSFMFKSASTECGRDDRGQEAGLDVSSAVTMAPMAEVIADYDDVCGGGNDGTLALSRAMDLDPTVIVFPIVVGPVDTTISARYGLTPLPQLEALVRGIPLVVPAGDDGAYGYKETGIEKPRVAWPCVSTYVICVGGTQLGDRDGVSDEGPWNDLGHAGGGGISGEPRPAWQDAPGDFLFSTRYVHNRIVPDVAADAAGHLRVYWHGYGLGGVGGTSESASIVGAELAAINSLIGPSHRLLTVADLYALSHTAPQAFRDVSRENDRGWKDNTLRPRRAPLPKNFKGILPTPPPLVKGCPDQQPDGCTVTTGFDAVTGIGS